MPLKRTYSTTTTTVPLAKKRKAMSKKRLAAGTVGKPAPFPTRMVAKLRYCETITLSSSLLSIQNANFACNSIYDPNLSGSGHQPYGHDTYSNIYNQYTVLASTLKMTVVRANDSSRALTYGVGIEDSVSTSLANTVWAERPTYKVACGNQGNASSKPLYITWNRKKRFPSPDVYRTLSAPFGTNPSEIEIFNLFVEDPSGTNISTGVNVLVEIDYTVEMYEPIDLGTS